MNKKILIADDELRMRILISDFLSLEGYEILEAQDGKEALDIFTQDPNIHLVILDVMMPYFDGWQVCEKIRMNSSVPIIMLTAKNTEPDELTGFKSGADEYITKPFSPSIFVARVNALFNRTYSPLESDIIIKGALNINTKQHKVTVLNSPVTLSSTEFKLLTYMIENEGSVLTRENLLDQVWGYDYEGTDRTVDTHMNRLRIKLKKSGIYIKTIRGYGYKFEVIE
ncbi:response regulator transcription factor [Oceanirhabdus seepicola]|uniref:Stage 0 sporulation protein A homolog n=1 Tax=Oceanirhabdus seepicola TaxID=2828781 RepID=A0A9J6NZ33_9CLOT|nr:response regulator transcription factor [Oceanirhabdus seepicola]MCM1989539.1 response regulator transcription factor [Oceanirhabdus seepicola]